MWQEETKNKKIKELSDVSSFRRWLWDKTGTVYVFEKYIIGNELSAKQKNALKKLKINDLYHGKIELTDIENLPMPKK